MQPSWAAERYTALIQARSVRQEGMVNTDVSPVVVVQHPLVENSLVALRDVETGTDTFRRHARLLTLILAFHVLEDLPTKQVIVQTPLEQTGGEVIDRSVIFVPVLRAGLAMLDAMSDFVPGSKVGFVG